MCTHCNGRPSTQTLHGEPVCTRCFNSYERWVEARQVEHLDRQTRTEPARFTQVAA